MFIYNITTKVDHAILSEWLQWQKNVHIPDIMSTGLFREHHFFQLLEHEEEEGKTFVIQFITSTRINYDKYLTDFAPQLRKKSLEKWGDKVISFRTLLQNVQ